jgi:HAD superfamily hydrolase (TIGR01450 family)
MTASTAKSFSIHDSISKELIDRYDGFILDQFGVMHNGEHGLEGAPECVEALARQGKKLIILSNSSSLAKDTSARLPKLGFDRDAFVGAVTSGEEASHYIQETYAGKKCLFLTWKSPKTPSPVSVLQKYGNVSISDNVEEADFILLHGCEVMRGPGPDGEASETDLGHFMETGNLEIVDKILKPCLDRMIPMVCANPDFIYVKPDGDVASMPGKIAERYEQLGGSVTSFGKPHKEHFEACVRDLGLPKEKVVHVGDSIYHDIAGANATGISSILVVGGVHREELGIEVGSLPERDALEQLFHTHGETPTHVVPLLKL